MDPRCLKYGDEEQVGGNMIKQMVDLKSGIEKEEAKEITKTIKEAKLKVDVQIQDDQVRVNSKSIDELQAVMALLRGKVDSFFALLSECRAALRSP